MQLSAGHVLKNDAVAKNVGEEVAPPIELVVHVVQTVNDDAHWGLDLPLSRHCPVRGIEPELSVGEVFMVDNDEQVDVRQVATDRVMDTVAPRIGSVQYNVENLAVLEPLRTGLEIASSNEVRITSTT